MTHLLMILICSFGSVFAAEDVKIINMKVPGKSGLAIELATPNGVYSTSQAIDALKKVEGYLKKLGKTPIGFGFIKYPHIDPKNSKSETSYSVGYFVESVPTPLENGFTEVPGMMGHFARLSFRGDLAKLNYDKTLGQVIAAGEKVNLKAKPENWNFFLNDPKLVPLDAISWVGYYALEPKEKNKAIKKSAGTVEPPNRAPMAPSK